MRQTQGESPSLQPVHWCLCLRGIGSGAIQDSLERQWNRDRGLQPEVREESPSHLRGWKGEIKGLFLLL